MKHWMALVALAAAAAAHAAEPVAGRVVQAPHWGDALFHVYQGHTFTALTTLMASQQLGRIHPHDDEAEATRGGLLLAYGLHSEAEAVFIALAERGSSAALRDRAWAFLAQIRWQRGLPVDAESALARVAGTLPPAEEEARQLLAGQLRLAQGDPAGAATRWRALAESADGTPYARFNLGIALLDGGARDAGRAWLERLGRLPVTTANPEERRALRDRANLSLGIDALRAGESAAAREALHRVRLDGPVANPALLALGWAALQAQQPADALRPWQELLRRDPADPAVQEARLALPMALIELHAEGAALRGYGDAIAAYDSQTQALAQAISALQGGALVDALIGANPGADLGWGWAAETLPADGPHRAQAALLTPLLASHAWMSALKDQRDLRFFHRHLGRWAQDLQSFDTMLDTRRARFAARLPAAQPQGPRQTRERLAAERAALAAALAAAIDTTDAAALANPAEVAHLERLARVRRSLAELPPDYDDIDRPALHERLRRVAGALQWQLARAMPERRWAAHKALREIGAQLDLAAERETTLQAARRDEPTRFAGFAERITALRGRIAGLLPQVAALQVEQQRELQALAVQQLQSQQTRLAEYRSQAHFALARLQDPATVATHKDRDAAP